MTLYGYAGKILRLDLTGRRVLVVDTEKYRSWGGGHGLGSALFWDFCQDKTITDGRHPANVCIIATSALNGTPVPSGGGRCEVMGVGVGMYPVSWFTRSGFGGRFSTMLKQAGWDAIVIEGKASSPVWVDIRNDKVEIRDAAGLWESHRVEDVASPEGFRRDPRLVATSPGRSSARYLAALLVERLEGRVRTREDEIAWVASRYPLGR